MLVEKDQSILSIKRLISKYLGFPFLLLVVVLISYGQTLGMDVWRDAHAIFFKFNHLYERTGYLGNGILGEGTYRFSVAPYYYVYKLVGYDPIWAYYLLNLVFYFLAALSVYYLFSKLLNTNAGRAASLLFAAGYIGVEGFIDLAGSMIFNVSIILLCLCLLAYFIYSQSLRYRFYVLALGIYAFAIFLTPVRTHYFMGVLLLFDWLWLNRRKILLRLLPFSAFFYLTFLQSADSRTFSIGQYLKDILAGKFYNLYSFFGSLGYLFVPDKYIHYLNSFSHLKLTELLISICSLTIVYLFYRNTNRPIVKIFISAVLTFFWYLFSKTILSSPILSPGSDTSLAVFLGGLLIIVLINILINCHSDIKKYFVLLTGWLMMNLVTYTAYDPVSIISTVDRYIAHSFVPLVGLLSLAFFKKTRLFWLVIIWGALNLLNSVTYQHNVLVSRSFPARNFHSSLRGFLPHIAKGDILYFDVADNAQGHFNAAFTVGQMPNETAIAWRYGIDRYDFRLITEFTDLVKVINHDNVPLSQVYSFHYTLDGLQNTTDRFRQLLANTSKDFIPSTPIESLVPIEVRIQLLATPANVSQLKFPLTLNSNLASNSIAKDMELRQIARAYNQDTITIRRQMKVTTSSDWPENSPLYINDHNLDTAWRADRFIWADTDHADFVTDLLEPISINRLVWFNAYPNHSPIAYQILVSQNGRDWVVVKTYQSTRRLASGDMQIETFPTQIVRYIKMDITKTLSDDSPGISEVWVVPSKYTDLNLVEAEQYLNDPLGYISDPKAYMQTLESLNYTGKVQFSWQDNSLNKWSTLPNLSIPVKYDGQIHEYSLIIPTRGTIITDFKDTFTQIPGKLRITTVKYRHLTLNELQQGF